MIGVLLVACMPRIAAGPAAFQTQREPVEVVARAGTGVVHLVAVARAGSAYDPPGREGLGALTAWSAVHGGAGGRTAEEVRAALYPTGRGLDWTIDKEVVTFRLTCTTPDATLCAEVFADVLTAPRFAPNEVLRIREQAAARIRASAQEDAVLGEILLERALFAAHPYEHAPAGRTGSLGTLSPAEVALHHRRLFVRDNLVVGTSGLPDADLAALRVRLDAVPAGPSPDLPLPDPAPGPDTLVVTRGTSGTSMLVGFSTPLQDDPAHLAWRVAAEVLGTPDRRAGRLREALQGADSRAWLQVQPTQTGPYGFPAPAQRRRPHAVLAVQASPAEAASALRVALGEVERVFSEGITAAELESARTRLKAELTARNADRAAVLESDVTAILLGIDRLTVEALDTLDLRGLNAALAGSRRAPAAMVVVSEDPETLGPILIEDARVPTVYPSDPPSDVTSDGNVLRPPGVRSLSSLPPEAVIR